MVGNTSPTGADNVVYTGASADDVVDGDLPVTCTPASGSTFPLGITTVTCTATDEAGNIGEGTFTIEVQDQTKPVVTVPADITEEATGPNGATVTYMGVTAVRRRRRAADRVLRQGVRNGVPARHDHGHLLRQGQGRQHR